MEWNSALTSTFLQGILQDGNRFRHAFLHSSLDVQHGMVNLLADKMVHRIKPTCRGQPTPNLQSWNSNQWHQDLKHQPAFCYQSVSVIVKLPPIRGSKWFLFSDHELHQNPIRTSLSIVRLSVNIMHSLFGLALIVRAAESWLHPGRA